MATPALDHDSARHELEEPRAQECNREEQQRLVEHAGKAPAQAWRGVRQDRIV
jgi:hypothetical protein